MIGVSDTCSRSATLLYQNMQASMESVEASMGASMETSTEKPLVSVSTRPSMDVFMEDLVEVGLNHLKVVEGKLGWWSACRRAAEA